MQEQFDHDHRWETQSFHIEHLPGGDVSVKHCICPICGASHEIVEPCANHTEYE